jgi:hypothetical protein
MLAEVLEHDPAGGILAFRSMLRGRIAMPGRFMDDGRDPDLFDLTAEAASHKRCGVRACRGGAVNSCRDSGDRLIVPMAPGRAAELDRRAWARRRHDPQEVGVVDRFHEM